METQTIADEYTRNNQAFKNMRNVDEGRMRKQYSLEDTRWTCPGCGSENNVSLHTFSQQKFEVKQRRRHSDDWDNYNEIDDEHNEFDDLDGNPNDNRPYADPPEFISFHPVITPRIYHCSHCGQKRFYWRDGDLLKARFVGKYEDFDELAFASVNDPWKFYDDLTNKDPQQTKLF